MARLRPTFRGRFGLSGCLLLLLLASAGCQKPSSDENGAGGSYSSTGEDSPQQILDGMIAAYQNATSYADSGELYLRVVRNGKQQVNGPIPFSVTFERPNKIRVQAYGANVVCDGKKFRASVATIDGQVLATDAPERLLLEVLLADPKLSEALKGDLDMLPITLKLLLAERPLEDVAGDAPSLTKVKDERLDGRRCQLVRVRTSDGNKTYWIDASDHLLRKLELPTAALKKRIDFDGNLSSVELWAEFKGAQVGASPPQEAFEFDAAGAKLVSHFVEPAPEPPNAMLGKSPGKYSFVGLDGKRVTSDDLHGKVAVLDWWATWCHWCFKSLPNVQEVSRQFKGNDKVVFLTVNTSDADSNDDAVRASFEKAGLELPIVRDADDMGSKVFKINGLPTMYLLGSDGTIQFVETGYQADLTSTLPDRLNKLLAGENLSEKELKDYEEKRAAFEQRLAEALVSESTVVEIPQATTAPKSLPEKVKLEKLWVAEGIKAPGNILVQLGDGKPRVGDHDQPTVMVLDGWRNVAQVGPDGKVTARRELEIPAKDAVSYLRTATGDGQRYYAAFASAQQQFYVFDQEWKLLGAHPDSEHPGIADVQFSDLDGDGKPELNVGYLGTAGVHHVSLKGQRLWSDRALENVLRLAVIDRPADHGGPLLVCTSGAGGLTFFSKDGQREAETRIGSHAIHTVVVAELDGAPPQELCGLSANEVGVTTAVGFNLDGKELWTYALPKGLHQQPIEMLTFGPAGPGGKKCWILAGADGSIHFISASGEPLDKFHYGVTLTGIAAATLNDRPALLVSSGTELTAWAIDWPK